MDPVAIDSWCVRNLLMPIGGPGRALLDLDDENSKFVKFLRYYRQVSGSGTMESVPRGHLVMAAFGHLCPVWLSEQMEREAFGREPPVDVRDCFPGEPDASEGTRSGARGRRQLRHAREHELVAAAWAARTMPGSWAPWGQDMVVGAEPPWLARAARAPDSSASMSWASVSGVWVLPCAPIDTRCAFKLRS